jgi:hypothetical protein
MVAKHDSIYIYFWFNLKRFVFKYGHSGVPPPSEELYKTATVLIKNLLQYFVFTVGFVLTAGKKREAGTAVPVTKLEQEKIWKIFLIRLVDRIFSVDPNDDQLL